MIISERWYMLIKTYHLNISRCIKREKISVSIVGAQECLDQTIALTPCRNYDLTTLRGFQDYHAAAGNADSLRCVEECMAVWVKQIELVLAESEQMRREADNIGPRVELDHWRKRQAKFNYLVEQIKLDSSVRAVLGVLHAAKSKTLKVK